MISRMHFLSVLALTASASSFAADGSTSDSSNFYGSLRLNTTQFKAHDMASSARPGLGRFVPGDESSTAVNGAVALGYQLPSNWRAEVEYTLPKRNEFTSGSTNFPTSFNHHQIRSQRLMLNAYKDFPLNPQFSLYGMAGVGVAHLRSTGWQGNEGRQYVGASQNRLAYSLGLGVSYSPLNKVNIDLGYRYVMMGKAKSGANNFTNVRGLADEQMRAKLTSSEVSIGLRYSF